MEDITLTRLQGEFDEVIAQINDIVERKDIDAARKVLKQVGELVSSEEHVPLDDQEGYDHILHRLLANISGVIEIAQTRGQNPELDILIEERESIDRGLALIDEELKGLGEDGTVKEEVLSIKEVKETIDEIRASIIGRRLTLNHNDLKEDTRIRIQAEIIELEGYLRQLKEYVNGRDGDVNQPVDTSEIDAEIARREEEIESLTKDIERIETGRSSANRTRSNNIAETVNEINNLKAQIAMYDADIEAYENSFPGVYEIDIQENEANIRNRADAQARLEAVLAGLRKNNLDVYNMINEIDNLRAQIAMYDANIEDFESNFPNADEEETRENEANIRNRAETQRKLDELMRTLGTIGNRQLELSKEIDNLKAQIAMYDANIEDFESNFPNADEEETRENEANMRAREDAIEKLKKLEDELNRSNGDDGEKKKEQPKSDKKLEELERKKKELEELKNKRSKMLEGQGKNGKAEKEMRILMLQAKIGYLKIRKSTAERNGNIKDKNKKDALIKEYESKLTEIEKTTTTRTTDNSERRKELLSKREELLKRKEDVDNKIEQFPGKDGKEGDKLDLGEEAGKIGDHIFKTARIREELTSRGYTREDFLSFYEQGRARTKRALEEIKQNRDQLIEVYSHIVGDESGTNLDAQLSEASDESARIAILEKIRQNIMNSSPKLGEELAKLGLDSPITTSEGAVNLEKIFEKYKGEIRSGLEGLRIELDEHALNLKVFDREISRINDERESVRLANGVNPHMESKIKAEKELRGRQVRATIIGDEELEKEWDERARRFVSHRTKGKHVYVGSDGEQHEIEYDTIEDYEEYERDSFFLNLKDYKRYLENVSKFAASNGDPNALDLSGHEYDEYHRLLKEDPEKAGEWLVGFLSEQEDYVRTFHGFTNEHAVKFSTWRTAGSTLEAMLPVRGDLPTTTKMKNALTNTARFMMLRRPRFSRIDENGNTIRDAASIVSGLLTTAIDGMVIGGAAWAVAGGGLAGLIPLGVYYGAKGVVTIGNVVAGRREYNKHKEEIDSNIPTLGHATARDREVARRNYYREVDQYSRPRAWFRSKMDKYFTTGRALETEESIIQRTLARVNATIDERTKKAIENAKANVVVAERNQKARVDRTLQEIRSANAYNDIVRDPDSVDLEQAASIAAQNAAVKADYPDYVGADMNSTSQAERTDKSTSQAERTDKYVKEEGQYEKTEDLESIKIEGGTASVAAITEEQKYRSRMERQDAINWVTTMIITAAANLAIAHIQGKLSQQKQEEVQDPDRTETFQDEKVVNRTEEYVVDDFKKVKVTKADETSISDLTYSPENYSDTYGAISRGAASTTGKGERAIDAITIRTQGPDGTEIEWSIAERGSGMLSGYHVHGVVDKDISNWSLPRVLKLASKSDATGYSKYCEATGLSGKSFEKIAKHALKNHHVYGQSRKMEGWGQVISGGLKTVTQKVKTGSHVETKEVFDHIEYFENTRIVPGKIRTITTTMFSPEEIGKRALMGLGIGAGGAAIEAAHELAWPTDKTRKGNFEEKNPDLLMARVAREAQKAYDKRKKRENEELKNEPEGPNNPIKGGKKPKEPTEPEGSGRV